jgi:hypothetical protein
MVTRFAQFATFLSLVAITAIAAGQGEEPGGQRIVQQSARRLYEQSSLEAEFRYRIEAFGQTSVGSGKYVQAGEGPEKLFRLEMSTQLIDRKATMQMICGRQYLWVRRDLGPDNQSLSRVTLRRLRQAIAESGEPLSIDPSPAWIGVVGLPRMLTALEGWFLFDDPRETMLGDRRVYQLRGTINAELRDSLLGEPGKKGEGRDQIPDVVELTLGTDEVLPLFPYRIEYFKPRKSRAGGTDPVSPDSHDDQRLKTMLVIDFSSAKIAANLDPNQFEYAPGYQEVEDRTRVFLERLGFQGSDEK